MAYQSTTWRLRTRSLTTEDHTLIMGVVNATPDSFSDGGAFFPGAVFDVEAAIAHGLQLASEGADIVDVGGESTRPYAEPVSEAEELERAVPVVAALAAEGLVVSIDTMKPSVARAALEAGAEIVNDITAMADDEMVSLCAEVQPGVVLMHMQGTPLTMQIDPRYEDVTAEVLGFLAQRAATVVSRGIDASRICLDPGIGFGKRFEDNLRLLADLDRLVAAGHPVLLGTSRKGFLGEILRRAGRETAAGDRDPATAATTALGIAAGVSCVRVHDVAGTLQVARTADAIVRAALD